MNSWYYAKNEQRIGPISENDLRKMVLAKGITETDLVWREGFSDWVRAGTVQGLFSLGSPQLLAATSSTSITTSANVGQLNLVGSIGNRLLASFYDSLFALLLGMLLAIILLAVAPSTLDDDATMSFIVYLFFVLYYALPQSGRKMATWGKRMRHLIVVDTSGKQIGFGRSVIRAWLLVLSNILVLPLLVILITKRRQGIHDLLCRTVVIDSRTYAPENWSWGSVGKKK